MSQQDMPTQWAVVAEELPLRSKPSAYPEPFFSRMLKREKRPLGDYFGLKNFGVNLTRIAPGGESALLHRHSKQDEFIYILQGQPTLVTDQGEIALSPGMCAGFPAGGVAHQLVNRPHEDVVYLEVGDCTAGDEANYPRKIFKPSLEPMANGFSATRMVGLTSLCGCVMKRTQTP